MAQSRRAARSSASWGCRFRVRPSLAVVHRSPQRAAAAGRAEGRRARSAVMRRVCPPGQVTWPVGLVDGEVVDGEPARHGRAQRQRFDHRGVSGRVGQGGAQLAGAVGRIAQHLTLPARSPASRSRPDDGFVVVLAGGLGQLRRR